MPPTNAQRLWLKLLGGKPEHAGLGIATIAFLVALVGAAIAFLSPASPERGSVYWLG